MRETFFAERGAVELKGGREGGRGEGEGLKKKIQIEDLVERRSRKGSWK